MDGGGKRRARAGAEGEESESRQIARLLRSRGLVDRVTATEGRRLLRQKWSDSKAKADGELRELLALIEASVEGADAGDRAQIADLAALVRSFRSTSARRLAEAVRSRLRSLPPARRALSSPRAAARRTTRRRSSGARRRCASRWVGATTAR